MPKRTKYKTSTKARAPENLREVAVAPYDPAPPEEVTVATTRLSGKNQITIPVGMCRLMDMRPGDEIELLAIGDTVHLQRLPRTAEEWAHRFDNAPATPGWGSDEEIDEYVRKERASWNKEYDWPQPTS